MLWPGVVRWYIIKYPWLDGIGLPKYGSIIFSFKNSLSVLQELSSNVSKIDILYKLLQNKFEQFSCKMKEQFCVKDKGFNQFDIAFIICKIKSCLSPMRFKHDTMWYCLNPFESLPEICFARVGPKFEPCYVSLQVVVLSEATYNVHAWIQLPCQQISSPCIKHDFLNCCKGSIQPHPIFCCLLALSLSPFMYRCRSLRKVMLCTCLDTADTSTKEFPTSNYSFFHKPTQKIDLPAGPKFEPFYISLQVAAQSDATYVPGYSWHVNKRVPDGNINYSCHGSAQSAQPSHQLLGREGHLWQWGHLWKQNYWQYSLQADNSFHRPNSNSYPGRYTGSAYTSAGRVLTFVWS